MKIFLQFACLALGIAWFVFGFQVEAQVWLAASVVIGAVRRVNE